MSSRSKVGIAVSSAHKQLVEFAKEHPEFARAAQEAIRPWERSEQLLLGAVGTALLEMYEHGRAGRDISKVFLQPTAKPDVEDLQEEDPPEDDEQEDEPPKELDPRARLRQQLNALPPVKRRLRRRRS